MCAHIELEAWGSAWPQLVARRAAIVLFLGLSSCIAAAQNLNPPKEWATRFTSEGVEFAFEELERKTVPGNSSVVYKFRFSGFPRDKTYALWAKWLDGKTVRFGEFQVDDTGDLVGTVANDSRPIRMSKYTVHFSRMYKGEPIIHALVSTDSAQTIKAFARTVPFPIRATGNGQCSLEAELLLPRGRPFAVMGHGFKPNEKIGTVSRSWPEVVKGNVEVEADGRFGSLVDPGVIGHTGGAASFTAVGESCEVTLQYEWGTAMKFQ
jgi:hypothetical protein